MLVHKEEGKHSTLVSSRKDITSVFSCFACGSVPAVARFARRLVEGDRAAHPRHYKLMFAMIWLTKSFVYSRNRCFISSAYYADI